MPVPNYVPKIAPTSPGFTGFDTTDMQPDTQNLSFSMFGSKNAYYQFIGEQDGMEGVGPHSVQLGDEQFQSDYNYGWSTGNYFRTMAGVNNVTL